MVLRAVAARTPVLAALVGAVLVALLVGLLALRLGGGEGEDAAERCARLARVSDARAERESGDGPRVVVIGDSYSLGVGLERLDRSWPSRLPGRVRVAGFSGSGFSARASACGRVSFADRAPAALDDGADLVVVQGGLNDSDRAGREIRAGFRALARVTGGTPMLVVGPPPAPARRDEVARVDRLLAALAARHGATYLSMVDAELDYLDDDLHLTADGHAAFGDAVAARVSAARTALSTPGGPGTGGRPRPR